MRHEEAILPFVSKHVPAQSNRVARYATNTLGFCLSEVHREYLACPIEGLNPHQVPLNLVRVFIGFHDLEPGNVLADILTTHGSGVVEGCILSSNPDELGPRVPGQHADDACALDEDTVRVCYDPRSNLGRALGSQRRDVPILRDGNEGCIEVTEENGTRDCVPVFVEHT